MKKTFFISLACAAMGLFSYSTIVNAAINNAKQLTEYFEKTKTLEADFIQKVYASRGEQQNTGKLWLKQPGKFYWDYLNPDRQKIISNGKTVYQYDLDLQQISIRSRSELVGDVALKVLSGEVLLDKAFKIDLVTENNVPSVLREYPSSQIFMLSPKDKDVGYDHVFVVFSQNMIKALMVDSGRGQQTVLDFSDLKRNTTIPDSRFEFTPPKGVDVIGAANS